MIIDGNKIAKKHIEELKIKVENVFVKINRYPQLVIIQVGDNPASNSYIKSKLSKASKASILTKHLKFPIDVSEEELLNVLRDLNSDNDVDGIIIQQPLPKHLNSNKIMQHLDPNKDADGFTCISAGKLFLGDNDEYTPSPATPKGIITLLNEYDIKVEGLNACVIGRSNIVGLPIARMLTSLNATVTICHSKTKNINYILKHSDLIVCALGRPYFLKENMVKKNSIIIDVGINRVDEKIVGDADYNNLVDKVKYITPVPGGVGPMTVVSLLENTYQLYLLHNKSNLSI